jgi:hypothetical protein
MHAWSAIFNIVCFKGLFGSGFWREREGRGGDILNFYVWFNFLTMGREGMREVIYFFTLNFINSK